MTNENINNGNGQSTAKDGDPLGSNVILLDSIAALNLVSAANEASSPISQSAKKRVTTQIEARGTKVMLPSGGIPEVLPQYIKERILEERKNVPEGKKGPFELQFVAQPELEKRNFRGELTDSLHEREHMVAPGLVVKYPGEVDENGEIIRHGRALWTITYNCAAYCRFCTRATEVGVPKGFQLTPESAPHVPHLSDEQIIETLRYIENASEKQGLREVILSGGDPLTINPQTLQRVLKHLGDLVRVGTLDIVRIGTRLPIQNPRAFKEAHYKAIQELDVPHMMIHVNHPDELTSETLEVWKKLRHECGAVIRTQTVLLKGVNDDPKTLYELFRKIVVNGGCPYYLYQNDPVYWGGHFTVPIREAIQIWQELRKDGKSGLATTAKFVIDAPDRNGKSGYGKIVVPEGGAWQTDYEQGFLDTHGQHYSLDDLDAFANK